MINNRISIVKTIPAIFVLILGLVVVTFCSLAWSEYQRTQAAAKELVSSRAQLVSTHAEWLVSAGVQTITAADRLAGQQFPAIDTDQKADIFALVDALPGDAHLSFTDLQGKIIYATDVAVASSAPIDVGEVLNAAPGAKPFISAMTKAGPAQSKFFLISRPVSRNGQILGVATLYMPVEVLESVWSIANAGPNATIGLIRDDGWLVARVPTPDEPLDLSKYVLFTDYLKKSDFGTYPAVSPLDGQVRMVGYRRVPNVPLIAIASADGDFVMKPFWSYFNGMAALLVCLMAVSGFALRWAMKLLNEDEARKIQLANSAERSNLLLREIHHRVKNNLQAVASIIRLQPMDPDTKRDLTSRIVAMSAVHEHSYQRDQFAELALQGYLQTLVENARQTLDSAIVVSSELDEVTIAHDVALPLGLIVNEVISNAAKHAFKDQKNPRIDIKLAWADDAHAELTVQDNGVGYSPSGDEKGMGSRLIKAFGQQLGGDYSYESTNGTLFRVRFPAKGRNATKPVGAAPAAPQKQDGLDLKSQSPSH